MKTKSIFIGIAIFLLGFVVSGSLKPRQVALAPTWAPPRHYAMNMVYSAWPGWAAAFNTIKKMSAAIPGCETTFGGPTDSDASKQIEEMNTLIEQRVSGIVINAADPKALTLTVNRGIAAGVPIVTMFSDADDSKRLAFVSADERGSARRLVEKLIASTKEKFKTKAGVKVLVSISRPGVPNTDLRLLGVKDALAMAPSMKLVDVVRDECDETKGAEAVSAAWQRYNGLDVIIGLCGRSPIGAIAAVKERNIGPGVVTITGWDDNEDVLQRIKDGWIEAVSAPNIGYMTQLSITILEAHNLGYLAPLPQRIEIEQTYINKDNVDAYIRKGTK